MDFGDEVGRAQAEFLQAAVEGRVGHFHERGAHRAVAAEDAGGEFVEEVHQEKRLSQLAQSCTLSDIRILAGRFYLDRGSSASRNPSPRKLSASSVADMIAAGKISSHQLLLIGIDRLRAVAEQRAPTRLARIDAQAQVAQETLVEDDRRDRQGQVNGDDAGQVRQQVAGEDFHVGLPEAARRRDELLVLEHEHLPAHDARHRQPLDQPEREDEHQRFRVGGQRAQRRPAANCRTPPAAIRETAARRR